MVTYIDRVYVHLSTIAVFTEILATNYSFDFSNQVVDSLE